MRILVVEDDEWRWRTFRRWLRGHDVRLARTSQEAIQSLSTEDFDLIFLDHDLDGKVLVSPEDRETGAEVARFLREQHIKTPVVVHSHNPEGAAHILRLLPNATAVPWGELLAADLPNLLLAAQNRD